MKNSIFITLLFSIFLIFSCATDDTCTQSRDVKLTVGLFQVIHNDTTHTTTTIGLSVDSFTVQGLKSDSVTHQFKLLDSLYIHQNTITSFNLPLNNFAKSSSYKIRFNTVTDTMTIYHANLNDYLSLECGCIVTHSIDTVIMTRHYIDSVKIKIHEVNTLNIENISLFKFTKKTL